MKRLFLMLAVLTAVVMQGAGELKIRGEKFGNWWLVNEPIVFKSEKASPGPVTATVRDITGKTVFTETVPSDQFNRNGWRWQTAEPGFYDVEFVINNEVEVDFLPVKLYKQNISNKKSYDLVEDTKVPIARHNFMVAAAPTRAVAEISPQFGMSPHGDRYKTILPLSRLVGFGAIRYHAVQWDKVEKNKGECDWSELDDFFQKAHELGYTDDRIVLNVFGVPQWASSRPEADWVNICVKEYATVIPRDMQDWRNFLQTIMRRYPNVRNWELWNEPHLVGFSCFWADSTENFVALLKAGYETVKAENKDNVVIMGGIGMRYLPFYKEFLEKGGGKYYDVFGVHCSSRQVFSREMFAKLDELNQVPVRPWRVTEWHANLLNPHMTPYPSERMLARSQLLCFMQLIRQGAEAVDYFCITNNEEKEELPLLQKHQLIGHTAGVFRRRPYFQPRYVGAAWHVFSNMIKGQLKVGNGYDFAGSQSAILFSSEAGSGIAFWNYSDQPVKIAPELLAAVKDCQVTAADGRIVKVDAQWMLAPEEYYLAAKVDLNVIKNWRNPTEVLIPRGTALTLDESVTGEYYPGGLFDQQLQLLPGQTIPWQAVSHYVANPEVKSAPGSVPSARFSVGYSPSGLDLIVEVADQTHCPNPGPEAWKGDSVQFAIDTAERGYASDLLEFSLCRDQNGKTVLLKQIAPPPSGDLPDNYVFAGNVVTDALVGSEQAAGVTVYKVYLPNAQLYPYAATKGGKPRFSLLVNNNDGAGRAGYLEWASGIGGDKNPVLYGRLTPQIEDKIYLSGADFKYKTWDLPYLWSFTDNVITIKANGAPNAGLVSREVAVTPGGRYRFTFEAKGSGNFQLMVQGKGVPRTDLVMPTPLGAEFRRYDLVFYAPAEAVSFTPNIFFWQQPQAEMQVRDFKVTK